MIKLLNKTYESEQNLTLKPCRKNEIFYLLIVEENCTWYDFTMDNVLSEFVFDNFQVERIGCSVFIWGNLIHKEQKLTLKSEEEAERFYCDVERLRLRTQKSSYRSL